MFLGQISGKLSLMKETTDPQTQQPKAWVTLTERRWVDGQETFLRHFLAVPTFSVGFAKKCIEKDWKVIAFVENPVAYTDREFTDAGYMFYADLKSIQIP